jgi:hypothetical protein
VRREVRRQLGRVDPDLRVLRRLVRVGDAGELLDDPGPRLGVEPLPVALLADLQRRGDVDLQESAQGSIISRTFARVDA